MFLSSCAVSDSIKSRTDSPAELALVCNEALAAGADAAVVSNHWAEGGKGAVALAKAVVQCCESPSDFKFLYDLNLPIEEKILIICKEIYGADGIELSDAARKQIETYTRQGYSGLPSMCIFDQLMTAHLTRLFQFVWPRHSIRFLMMLS